MTVLVNLGYGSIADGWDQGPANVPTPFEPFPTDLNWSDVLTALVNGVPQGIQAAIADLENPDNYQIPLLRERNSLHPIIVKVMAIHVAEGVATSPLPTNSSASVSHKWFSGAASRCRCTGQSSCGCCARRSSCRRAASSGSSTSRALGKELFFNAPDSRQALRDMYGDVRMLCDDGG